MIGIAEALVEGGAQDPTEREPKVKQANHPSAGTDGLGPLDL